MLKIFKKKQSSSKLPTQVGKKAEPTVRIHPSPVTKISYKIDYEFTTTLGEKFTKVFYRDVHKWELQTMLRNQAFIEDDNYPSKSYNTKYIVDFQEKSREEKVEVVSV